MKVGIDARFLTHPQVGGFKTYTTNLISALAKIDHENDYIIYTDRHASEVDLPKSEKFLYLYHQNGPAVAIFIEN